MLDHYRLVRSIGSGASSNVVLAMDEVRDLVSFLQTGGYKLPEHLKKVHDHKHEE